MSEDKRLLEKCCINVKKQLRTWREEQKHTHTCSYKLLILMNTIHPTDTMSRQLTLFGWISTYRIAVTEHHSW